MNGISRRRPLLLALALGAWAAAGCHSGPQHRRQVVAPADVPRELDKVSLPEYRVEPPDILLIEAVRAIPKPPYKVEPLDVLYLSLAKAIPNEPFGGPITVEPDGRINLGPAYGGSVEVVGKSLPEVKEAIEKLLSAPPINLDKPQLTVSLAQGRAGQQIGGPHLIRPDGTVSLGTYGSVRVVGMTLPEVRAAIEAQLSAKLLNPEVSVDVQSYNSKVYYVVLDGGGAGQTVVRLPVTGNETVVDAISQVNGLSAVSSQDRIWVARPVPGGSYRVLPVDWGGVVECGSSLTNYQLMPGDRVYVAAYPVTKFDITLARVLAPVERLFGVVLLGNGTVQSFRNNGNNGFGGGGFIP